MRLGAWSLNGLKFEGIFVGPEDNFEALPFTDGTTVQSMLEAGLPAALTKGVELEASGGARHPASEIELLAPYQPLTVRDGVAFEAHVEGVVKSVDNSEGVTPEWYDYPTFYFTNPWAIIGTGVTMTPPPTERLDYELELGVVIGRTPDGVDSNLTQAAAKDAIFGYLIFNDWSARDIQSREMKVRLGPAKGKDFATTIGPWIVTADEFADRIDSEGFLDVQMQVFVNGHLYGQDNAASIGWPLNEMVAYASRNTHVRPGDLIGSGTCGQGCLGELWGRAGKLEPAPLQTGDVVEMTIEGIGRISNRVGAPVAGPAIPPARRLAHR